MRKRFIAMVGTVALAGVMTGARLQAQNAPVQSPATQAPTVPQWQTDAGGKMAFDVASVKPNKSGGRLYSNVSLAPGDAPPPNGGLFSATNYQLVFYIAFAYNLTVDQTHRLSPQLPPWASTEFFDIEARTQGNPTRDQMRLMMQSLLADRFKLAVHTEIKQEPVYALVLSKPGKTGPQLQPHVDDGSCSTAAPPGAVTPKSATGSAAKFPPVCSIGLTYMPSSSPGRERAGARNMTMGQLATFITVFGAKGGPRWDGPIVDRTGLIGNFDFAMEFAPQIDGPLPPGANFTPDPNGPTFLEALQDQLGLKAERQTGPVDVLIIDHVEEPTPN